MQNINRKLLANKHMSMHIPLLVIWYDFSSMEIERK